jgi:non-homologous end joining protein Ku
MLLRWGNVALVSGARSERPASDPALVTLATTVFEHLSDTFDLSSVLDDYDARLRMAVDAAAAGKELPKAAKVAETPLVDLMEALKATVAAAGEKEKPARKRTTKAKTKA